MSEPNLYDTIVVGAGAAGLMAGASSAGRGQRTLVLEKNKKLGVKILMSGGTRCNITHHCNSREIAHAFGPGGRFLHSALAALSPERVVQLFNECGVETKVESTGKVFPVSNRAIDVRDALVRYSIDSGCEIRNLSPVVSIQKSADVFQVRTEAGISTSRSLIITSGGQSYPGCGTTGDGYFWASQFGHTIVKPVPALTPILCRNEWANGLRGVTVDDVMVQVVDPDNKKKANRNQLDRSSRRGSFLFTHFGFSGPTVLDVSQAVTRHENPKRLKLVCDFWPSMSRTEILNWFNDQKSKSGKISSIRMLQEQLTRRLAEQLVANAGGDLHGSIAELPRKLVLQIIEQIKACTFSINGTLGFEKAEVTAGGVCLDEIDGRTMQSKLVQGLFFAGEILDLDGLIGGYNFQSAFSTGWLAGQCVNSANQ